MIRMNLMNHRFIYLAHENAMVAHHFNWKLQMIFRLTVRRTRAFSWYMFGKRGPVTVVTN